jgi:hypothetical protein
VVGELTVLVAVALAGAGLAACDDDGGGEPLTEAEFQAQANAICGESNTALDEEAEDVFADVPSGEVPSEAELETFADFAVPNIQGQIDDIRDLEAPDDIQGDVDDVLDETEGVLDEIADDPSVIAGDEDPFADVDSQLNDLGLTSCV